MFRYCNCVHCLAKATMSPLQTLSLERFSLRMVSVKFLHMYVIAFLQKSVPTMIKSLSCRHLSMIIFTVSYCSRSWWAIFPTTDKFKDVMLHGQVNLFMIVLMRVNRDVDKSRTASFFDFDTKRAVMLSSPSQVPDPLHPDRSRYSKSVTLLRRKFFRSIYSDQFPWTEHHGMLRTFVPIAMILGIKV